MVADGGLMMVPRFFVTVSGGFGDPIAMPFAAVHESEDGTNAKCRPHGAMSEFEGKAENICSR
jgi:hypothetical protein